MRRQRNRDLKQEAITSTTHPSQGQDTMRGGAEPMGGGGSGTPGGCLARAEARADGARARAGALRRSSHWPELSFEAEGWPWQLLRSCPPAVPDLPRGQRARRSGTDKAWGSRSRGKAREGSQGWNDPREDHMLGRQRLKTLLLLIAQ